MSTITFYNVRRMRWFGDASLSHPTVDEVQLSIADGQPDIGTFEWRDHGSGRHVPRFSTFCDGWAHLPDALTAAIRSLGCASGGPYPTVADVESMLLALGAVDESDIPAVRA